MGQDGLDLFRQISLYSLQLINVLCGVSPEENQSEDLRHVLYLGVTLVDTSREAEK